jgi:hypothetical protein
MKLQRYFSEISYDNDGRAEGTYAVADSNGIFVLADAHEARIAELEGALALAYFGIRELKSQFEFCDCSDDPQDDICLHCILGNIMHDIEKQKGVGGGE